MCVISTWFTKTKEEATPKTPERLLHPYVESPTGDEGTNPSPEYKGEELFEVVHRESLPRKSKDIVNSFRLGVGEEGPEEGLGSSDRERSGDSGDDEEGG